MLTPLLLVDKTSNRNDVLSIKKKRHMNNRKMTELISKLVFLQ